MKKVILVAGATGNLGQRIVKTLIAKGAAVRAIVRIGTSQDKLSKIEQPGVEVYPVDLQNVAAVTEACKGVSCVVSALQGLHDVIVDTQKILLDAAVAAKVPRFIPSDFSVDFTDLPAGENRNFDLRKEFHTYLDKAPIQVTSIFNGAFGLFPPLLNPKEKTIGYWGGADHKIYVTNMDDTAAYTAAAALDDATPKKLVIGALFASPSEMVAIAEKAYGSPFKPVQMGSVDGLAAAAKNMRAANPDGEKELYPRWQQMQYLQSMFTAQPPILDNNRYADIQWTPVEKIMQELPGAGS